MNSSLIINKLLKVKVCFLISFSMRVFIYISDFCVSSTKYLSSIWYMLILLPDLLL